MRGQYILSLVAAAVRCGVRGGTVIELVILSVARSCFAYDIDTRRFLRARTSLRLLHRSSHLLNPPYYT